MALPLAEVTALRYNADSGSEDTILELASTLPQYVALRTLRICRIDLRPDVLIRLLQQLPHCILLTEMSLKFIDLSRPRILSTLGMVLHQLPMLETLILSGCQITTTNVLAPALVHCTRLAILMMHDNPFSSAAETITLIDAVCTLPNLRYLNLSETNMQPMALLHLANRLSTFCILTTLGLDGNADIGSHALRQLTAAVEHCPSLVYGWIYYPNIDAEVENAFHDACRANELRMRIRVRLLTFIAARMRMPRGNRQFPEHLYRYIFTEFLFDYVE
jgi:hypothetical protein